MKVYVVEFGYDYEGGEIEGVFKDKDQAFSVAKKEFDKEKLECKKYDNEKFPHMQSFDEPNLEGNNYYKKKSFCWNVNCNYYSVREFDVQ